MKNSTSVVWTSLIVNCALLAAMAAVGRSANILVFAPMPFKSHFFGFQPLFKELAKRGHNLTVVSPFPLKKPTANYTDIPIAIKDSILKDIDPMELASHNIVTAVPHFWKMSTSLSSRILSKPSVQQFILSEDRAFDLVVVFAFYQEYSVALGHKYGAPVMNLGVSMLWPSTSKWIGEPSTFAYVLDQRTGATDRMSFVERLRNTAIGAFQLFLEDYVYLPALKETVDKYFRYRGHESRPPIEDMLRNVSLTLVNAHLSVGVSRPYLPGTVETAGLHVNEPKPLTGKFLEFVESAEDGVIYFSFGTIVNPSKLPDSMIEIFINVLRRVKQKVMWKWDSKNLPPLPDHVMVSDWFPQADILGHPNVRLFITHGGLHGLEEATFHAKPIVGIPFFGDQKMNMRLAEQNGIGKMVDRIGLSENSMLSAINEVLDNPKYRENAKLRREIFNDYHMTPLDRAVYWVEYVLRHNGAKHLLSKSSALNSSQYFSVDVCFVAISVFVLSTFFAIKMVRRIVKNNSR